MLSARGCAFRVGQDLQAQDHAGDARQAPGPGLSAAGDRGEAAKAKKRRNAERRG